MLASTKELLGIPSNLVVVPGSSDRSLNASSVESEAM
jgi:hypothetical protein